jgi:hypothetical protein
MSENTVVLHEPQPSAGRAGTRGLVAVVASVLAVVLIAVGGYAALQFFSGGGPQPSSVLPASTFALVTVDLDPSGGQKVEAIKTLHKFPGLRKSTGLDSSSDVIESIVDETQDEGLCKKLNYQRDMKPWVGERLAFGGVVLRDKKIAPVLAMQVSDVPKARTGFRKVAKCMDADGEDFGWTMSGDYLVASNSQRHADAIVAAAKSAPLSQDRAYQRWTNEVGEPGIASFYVARQAPDVYADWMLSSMSDFGSDFEGESEEFSESFPEDLPSDYPTDLPRPSRTERPGEVPSAFADGVEQGFRAESRQQRKKNRKAERAYQQEMAAVETDMDDEMESYGKDIRKSYKDFRGAAGTLRFADGGIEIAFASSGAGSDKGATVADHVGSLPADTAAVLAAAVPDGNKLAGQLNGDGAAGMGMGMVPGMLMFPAGMGMFGEAVFGSTGMDLPEDLATLLGSSISLSVGADAPTDLDKVNALEDVPAGVLVRGDSEKIQAVITKIEKHTGQTLADVPATLKSSDGQVVIGTTPGYADDLLAEGSLRDQELFQSVVPDLESASSVAFVRLDGQWRDAFAATAAKDKGDAKTFANFDVIEAIGASGWFEGDTSHGLVRLDLK